MDNNELTGQERIEFLTDAESQVLLVNFMESRGEQGITEVEAAEFLTLVGLAKFHSASIDLALKGLVNLDYDSDGLVVKRKI